MGLLEAIQNLFKSNSQVEEKEQSSSIERASQVETPAPSPIAKPPEILAAEFEPGEKELVAAIASAGLAGSRDDVEFKVVSVHKVDQEMMAAAIIATAIVTGDKPDAHFRITNITRAV